MNTIKQRLTTAFEAIGLQQGMGLFRELTAALEDLVAQRNGNPKQLVDLNLGKIIQHWTGLNIRVKSGRFVNAYVYPPVIDINSPLLAMWRGYGEEALNEVRIQPKKIIALGSKGTIDLANSKVTGVFAQIPIDMVIGTGLWTTGRMTAEETAAVILHEVGHAFTFLETLVKTVTCNMAIHAAMQSLGPSDSMEHRLEVIYRVTEKTGVKIEDPKALADPKTSKKTFETILIKSTLDDIQHSAAASEVYDLRSSEFMADQFAVRHGAGRALVTGLDKLMTGMPGYKRGLTVHLILHAIWAGIVIAGAIMLTVPTLLLIGLILLCPGLDREIYDRPMERAARIKRDIIQTMKDPNLESGLRQQMLKDLELIDATIKDFKDRSGLLEVIWSSLTANRRHQRKQIEIQQQLEKLINSDLFVHAQQLKHLTA